MNKEQIIWHVAVNVIVVDAKCFFLGRVENLCGHFPNLERAVLRFMLQAVFCSFSEQCQTHLLGY